MQVVARRIVGSEYLILLLCGCLFAGLAPFTPGLASSENVSNLAANLLPLLIVACGQTIVLITGGIDLSVTSTIALASVVGGFSMAQGGPAGVPVGIALMLGTGAGVGLGNGLAVAKLRMPPFIVTLTSMMFFSGLAIWLTKSKNIVGLPEAFTLLGNRLWVAILIAALLAVAAHFLLSRTLIGRWIYTVGHNVKAARVSGVPVAGTIIAAYVLSGIFAAAASVLLSARLETASPVMGQRMLLDVIGAAVLGGTSLFGGRGKILWTLYGAIFLTLLDNALNLLGLSYFATMIIKGVVILGAAALDRFRRLHG